MKAYRIINKISGLDMGTYSADSAGAAIEAMHRDAGYESSEDAARVLSTTVEELVAALFVKEAQD